MMSIRTGTCQPGLIRCHHRLTQRPLTFLWAEERGKVEASFRNLRQVSIAQIMANYSSLLPALISQDKGHIPLTVKLLLASLTSPFKTN